jgi:hypothetical protein
MTALTPSLSKFTTEDCAFAPGGPGESDTSGKVSKRTLTKDAIHVSAHSELHPGPTRLRNDDLVLGTLHWFTRVGNPYSREIRQVSRLTGRTWHLAAAHLCREARRQQEFCHRDDRNVIGRFT